MPTMETNIDLMVLQPNMEDIDQIGIQPDTAQAGHQAAANTASTM